MRKEYLKGNKTVYPWFITSFRCFQLPSQATGTWKSRTRHLSHDCMRQWHQGEGKVKGQIKKQAPTVICHIFYGKAAMQQVSQRSCGGVCLSVLSSRWLSFTMNHTKNKQQTELQLGVLVPSLSNREHPTCCDILYGTTCNSLYFFLVPLLSPQIKLVQHNSLASLYIFK